MLIWYTLRERQISTFRKTAPCIEIYNREKWEIPVYLGDSALHEFMKHRQLEHTNALKKRLTDKLFQNFT